MNADQLGRPPELDICTIRVTIEDLACAERRSALMGDKEPAPQVD